MARRAAAGRGPKLALAAASFAGTALGLEALARVFLPVPTPVRLREGVYVSRLPLVNGRLSDRISQPEDGPPLTRAGRPGERGLFGFGESSVGGRPGSHLEGAPTMLHDRLKDDDAGGSITVVNMGRASSFMMDSYYYLLAAAAYKPDVVVIYQGNNDRFDADREQCLPVTAPLLHAGWRRLVGRSRLLWSARALGPEAFIRWRGAKDAGGPQPFVKPRCDGREAFGRWAEILTGTARGLGARVVVTTPLRNPLTRIEIGSWRPGAPPLNQMLRELGGDYRSILRCELDRSCDPGRLIRAVLPDDQDEEIKGRAQAWRNAAREHGAMVVELLPALRRAHPRGLPIAPLVVDDVHLSIEGYRLLAGLWEDAVQNPRALGLGGAARPPRKAPRTAGFYIAGMRARGEPVERVYYRHALRYLRARMLLLAAPLLREAAAGGVAEARLAVAWLRRGVGLAPELPPGLKARWAAFDLDARLEDDGL